MLVPPDGRRQQNVVGHADAQQVVGIHDDRVLRDAFPHRQVAGFPPVSVSQRRFGAGSVGMHDETRPVVARQKIRNDFTKRLGVKPLVDAFDRSVHVLFRRRNPASRVT